MNENDCKLRAKFIRKTFDDERKIKCPVTSEELQIDEDVYPGGELFKTEDGDFIDLEFQKNDFDEKELVKYVELAEDIYEKHRRPISIYVVCSDDIDVCVREFPIKSEADFTIKLTKIEENPAEYILKRVKRKIRNGEALSEDDITELENSPMLYNRKDRHDHRLEVFKILNTIRY